MHMRPLSPGFVAACNHLTETRHHEEEVADPLAAAVMLVVGPDGVNEIDDVFHLWSHFTGPEA